MKQKIIKIIMEILKYEWELRDNKHTVEMLVSNWADRVIKVVREDK